MIMLNSVQPNSFYFLEFYLEKTESGECGPLTCTMRCELGDQNDRYYFICVQMMTKMAKYSYW